MARPQEFDRAEVVNAAIAVFHRQGYAATSVPDLVKATGLQPGSLYAAFGNKKGILVEALDAYLLDTKANINQCFLNSSNALDGIRQFFTQAAQQCSAKGGSNGCFMVNTLLEIDANDQELSELLTSLLKKVEALFSEQLIKAQQAGEIAQNQDTSALSKFLVCNLWGLQVLAKTRPQTAETKMVVDQIISHLAGCAQQA